MPPRCPPGFPGWPPRRGARGAWVSEGPRLRAACCARTGRGGVPWGQAGCCALLRGGAEPLKTLNSSAPSWERRGQRGEGAGGHLQPPVSPRCRSRGRAPAGCRRAGAAGRAAPRHGEAGEERDGPVEAGARAHPAWQPPACSGHHPAGPGHCQRAGPRGGWHGEGWRGARRRARTWLRAPTRGLLPRVVFPTDRFSHPRGLSFIAFCCFFIAPAPPAVPRGREQHPVPAVPQAPTMSGRLLLLAMLLGPPAVLAQKRSQGGC